MSKLAESEHNFCWSYKNLSSCDPPFRYVNLIRVSIRTFLCVRYIKSYLQYRKWRNVNLHNVYASPNIRLKMMSW